MAFLKKTAAPNRTAALLEFDIQLQAVHLEEIQRDRDRELLLNGNQGSGDVHVDENDSSSASVQLQLCASAKASSDEHEHDPVEIVNNLTSINDIRSSIFIDTENEAETGRQTAEPAKYFLCRVITPLIPVTVKAQAANHVDDEGVGCDGLGLEQHFMCIVDEPQSSSALRLQISFVKYGALPGNGSQRQWPLTVEKASQILPVGSILLLKNPSIYFYSGSMTLAYGDLEDLIMLDTGNKRHNKILEGVDWKCKIAQKFLNSSCRTQRRANTSCRTKKYASIEESENLLMAQKYSEALPNSTDAARTANLLSQSTTGRRYPVHQWLAAESSTSLQRLDCAEYEGPVHVQSIPGKGRGLVATAFMPKGSVILAKRAFVASFVEAELEHVTGSKALSAYDMAAFNAWTDVLNANKIARRLATEPELGKDVYNLYAGPEFVDKVIEDTTIVDRPRILEIVKYNGIANRPGLSSKTAPGHDCQLFTQQMTTGLWIRPAYINHSCSEANSFWKIWGDFLFVRAFADIEPGQEILMSYRGGLTQCSYLERRTALFNGMGFQCDCTLCRLESGFGKGVNQDIMDLLGEVQCLALNLNGLGSDMYRLTLVSIIEEMNSLLNTAVEDSGLSRMDLQGRAKNLLDVYLYQPFKLLAMTLLAEAEAEAEPHDADGCQSQSLSRSRSINKLQQVVQLLEKAHDLIQNTSDCSKSVGCCLDLIAVLSKLNEEDQARKWLNVLKSNLGVVYGCSDGDHLDEVLDLFLAKYKISTKSIHLSSS